jgi:hypothetical protein
LGRLQHVIDRDLDGEPVGYGPRPSVPTKLDAYKPIIEARLAAHPELSAVRLLDGIRAAGYVGGVRYALLVVLGYSRLLWCRFYPRQDMAPLLFDQMKAVNMRDLRLKGGALVRNAEFLRFAVSTNHPHWLFFQLMTRRLRARIHRPQVQQRL